jgi:hypothetical protein
MTSVTTPLRAAVAVSMLLGQGAVPATPDFSGRWQLVTASEHGKPIAATSDTTAAPELVVTRNATASPATAPCASHAAARSRWSRTAASSRSSRIRRTRRARRSAPRAGPRRSWSTTRPAAPSAEADAPEGRSRSRLAAHRLGRGAGPDGARLRELAERARPGERRVRDRLAVDVGVGDSLVWIERLMRAFGSPNESVSMELCGWGRYGATAYTFGASVPGRYMPDLERPAASSSGATTRTSRGSPTPFRPRRRSGAGAPDRRGSAPHRTRQQG